MARNDRAARKAAERRRNRQKRIQESKAKQRAAREGKGARSLLARARELPVAECVISKGWQDRGLAHILIARREDDGSLLVGGYYVDTLCTGLKDSAVIPNLAPDDYHGRVKGSIFNDPVTFEPCDPGLARAVVEGAIAFAERFGFRPNRRWEDAKRCFAGIEPAPDGLVFGRDGKPCLVVRPGENLAAARAKLDRSLGEGNYRVEVPDTDEE